MTIRIRCLLTCDICAVEELLPLVQPPKFARSNTVRLP